MKYNARLVNEAESLSILHPDKTLSKLIVDYRVSYELYNKSQTSKYKSRLLIAEYALRGKVFSMCLRYLPESFF